MVGYIKRGQSIEQLRGISGRAELWQAVWQEFEKSPALGHGYFITSANGRLDVWDGPANHDAHNLILQVLVSTGVIGGAMLIWALGSIVVGLLQLFRLQPRPFAAYDGSDVFFRLSCVVMLWYAGWCQGCASFLGPVRPESVVFFLLLGVLAGYREAVGLSIKPIMSGAQTA